MSGISTNKYNVLLNIQKQTNNLLFDFFDMYYECFVHKTKLSPDSLVDLNYKIVDCFNELKRWVTENNFEFKYKEMNHENTIKIYEDILTKKIYDLREYHLDNKFNPFYFTYLLVELYIILPYIMYEFLLQTRIHSSDNLEKNKYNLLVKTLTKDLYKNIKVLKEWDALETKIATLSFDENESPKGLNTPYSKIHQEFQDLMNQHYIIRNKYNESYKHITKYHFIYTKWWIFLLMAIAIVAILVIIIVYFNLNK